MARPYTGAMSAHQSSLPLIWLLSDARNDAGLERALAALPPGSGFVFRHYHLPPAERAERFRALATIARLGGHTVLLAGPGPLARQWGADGVYGKPEEVAASDGLIRLATAHDAEEMKAAAGIGADGVFLSPVFPTSSHPGTRTLGIHGFNVLAQTASIPVIALGGMTAERARELNWPRWGAIDGLVPPQSA
jgi:thiamine-phosphate pyrophosphorylase